MADPSALDLVMKSVGITGPASLGIVLGAILRGLLDGSAAQSKELRSGLHDRNQVLELKNDGLEDTRNHLVAALEAMRYQRNEARSQRNRAWERINAFETQAGVPVSIWPPDPPDPGGTP